MSQAQMDALSKQIVTVLSAADQKQLSTPDIEFELRRQGNRSADTFDVRDAVRTLITTGQAEFVHPGYFVKLTATK